MSVVDRSRTPPLPRLPADARGFDRDAVARGLTAAVEGEVRFGLHDRMLYATDASIYQVEPLGVVVPSSTEDAARAMRYCARHDLPVLPRGGGTSLAGQCTNRAVVLDVSAWCTAIGEVDEAGRRCRAEAGVAIDALNAAIRGTGLFFAPDPSTARQATVGGCIGNNAAGSHSILYGRTAENLLGVDVCLADGRRVRLDEGAAMRDPVAAELTSAVADIIRPRAASIRERFPKTLRRNAGYALDMILDQIEAAGGGLEKTNLAHLICGSEGTLATTLAADLRLHPIPTRKGLAVVAFGHLDDAIDAVVPLLALEPAAIELLDDLVIDLARGNLEHRAAVDLLPRLPGERAVNAVLYVEFYGGDDRGIDSKFERVRAMFPAGSVECHTEPRAMDRAWELRKAGEPLLHGVPGARKPLGFVEDNAVPPERLAEFVRAFRAVVEREGTRAAFYAHASVGVLHVRPLLDLRSAEDRARMERIAADAAAIAREMGGVMSGEHGDGRARGPLLDDFYGPEIMDAFRAVKAVFDPGGRLNPGNIVDPGPIASIHADTRVTPAGRESRVPPVDTFFRYDDQTDFAHAVEMCNGAGVCRKKTGGVMCPSYMATRDERHSTRGRGNALRLAISGQLSLGPAAPPAWGDAETEATLDLCLSCKACKSECPSNVDIARLKAEYQSQTYRATGRVPLRSRVFARVHELSAIAGRAPSLANFAATFGPTRAIANRLLGLHDERSLPRFARPLHRAWGDRRDGRERAGADLPADAPMVVLYADTFTTYNEPHIGLAARRVLEAFGYRVRLHRGADAGRAAMSVGTLGRAVAAADRELARLAPLIEDASLEAVVFIEPSVLSAVADDWLLLKLRAPIAARRRLADRAALLEQFLERHWETHPRRPAFRQPPGRVILHGHCHQKALWGVGSSADLLARVFPGKVDPLDTTCCGMAGSFGYTRDRFDLSMQIGELGLLPAARDAAPDDLLVAAGTSCRHQIHDGAGKAALHPAEALARQLRP